MATKRERSIPIKVNIDSRPAPTTLPPIAESELRPKPAPVKPTIKQQIKKVSPVYSVKQPVHEWPEAKRRRLMWWLVGGGMTAIVIGWLAVVRLEMNGSSGQNLFTETKKLFSNFHFPGTAKPNPAETEIRNLDNQVFPQFNK